MSGSSILREAWAALNFNRLRSVLTVASLGWGVACFVILYSYGEGFGAAVTTSLAPGKLRPSDLSRVALVGIRTRKLR